MAETLTALKSRAKFKPDSTAARSSGPPGDRNYQQGFYYPVYVAFYLAPTLHLPFAIVRKGFFWVLLAHRCHYSAVAACTAWSVPLWGQVAWSYSPRQPARMQGLKLQQITLFVVPLLAVAMALLVSDRPVAAGVLLALATIKPQLVLLLCLLTIWTVADWRRRYRWAASFLVSMAILWATSEWYLPHWVPASGRRFANTTATRRDVGDGRTGRLSLEPALELLAFTA